MGRSLYSSGCNKSLQPTIVLCCFHEIVSVGRWNFGDDRNFVAIQRKECVFNECRGWVSHCCVEFIAFSLDTVVSRHVCVKCERMHTHGGWVFCLFVVIVVDNVLVPTVISFAQVSTVKVNATRWALAMTPMVHAVKRYGLLLYTTCIGLMLRILTFEFVFQTLPLLLLWTTTSTTIY